jgi:hypothetical protein
MTGQIAYANASPSVPGATFSLSSNLTQFSGSNPVAFTSPNSSLSASLGGGTIVDTGNVGLVDGSTMNWGRWSGATQVVDPVVGMISPSTGVPFVVGAANTTIPSSGSFTYSLASGGNLATSLRAVDTNGVLGVLSGGVLQVNFGSTQSISVVSPLVITMNSPNNVTYTLGPTCTSGCTVPGPALIQNMSFAGTCSGPCTTVNSANATGIFVGPQAGGLAVAGNVTSTNSTIPLPTVTFGAGFKR